MHVILAEQDAEGVVLGRAGLKASAVHTTTPNGCCKHASCKDGWHHPNDPVASVAKQGASAATGHETAPPTPQSVGHAFSLPSATPKHLGGHSIGDLLNLGHSADPSLMRALVGGIATVLIIPIVWTYRIFRQIFRAVGAVFSAIFNAF